MTTDQKQNDFQYILEQILIDTFKSRKIKSKNWRNIKLTTAFPPLEKLEDCVGYATTVNGQDVLIKYKTGSFNHIYVNETRGYDSAHTLSGLRTAFNAKAQDINIPLRLYLLGIPCRGCDIDGGLISTFEYYNLFMDLKPMPQPKIKQDNVSDIEIPNFLYLNQSNLAKPFYGFSKPEDTLNTTIDKLSRGYSQLLELEKKCMIHNKKSKVNM